MKRKNRQTLKLATGILVSATCMYLAFRSVDTRQMWGAFKTADYRYLLPSGAVLFIAHGLRALRWRYFLDPVKRVGLGSLFSSLMIGYAANTFTPAHLGEFLRAYILSKKNNASMSSVFATIVVERMVDMFSLLALLLLVIFIYPFPQWVIDSGYLMLSGCLGLLVFLIVLKKATATTLRIIGFTLKPLPDRVVRKTTEILQHFLAGLLPLQHRHHYLVTALLSLVIWGCYALVLHFALIAFDFVETYHLEWSAALVVLVITTIAVIVPSSPGYIGTYHYLCQLSLALFGVPAGPALSFATVAHGVSMLPVFILGLCFAHYEGMAITKMQTQLDENAFFEGAQSGAER